MMSATRAPVETTAVAAPAVTSSAAAPDFGASPGADAWASVVVGTGRPFTEASALRFDVSMFASRAVDAATSSLVCPPTTTVTVVVDVASMAWYSRVAEVSPSITMRCSSSVSFAALRSRRSLVDDVEEDAAQLTLAVIEDSLTPMVADRSLERGVRERKSGGGIRRRFGERITHLPLHNHTPVDALHVGFDELARDRRNLNSRGGDNSVRVALGRENNTGVLEEIKKLGKVN